MNLYDWVQIFFYLVVLLLILFPLGMYMQYVIEEREIPFFRFFSSLERKIYILTGTDPKREMSAGEYMGSVLGFNLVCFIILYLILVLQGYLGLNPGNFRGLSWDLAFNTAVSFTTNTNWQAYSGESTLSSFSQMAGLGVQNFTSAATGMAVFFALTRALSRTNSSVIGNFWFDLIRSILYILLPLSIIISTFLILQGTVQSFSNPVEAVTLEGGRQMIPLGPAASQIAIKQLGTNGGGFFGVNSAHPFENPTPFSNFIQSISILILPASMIWTYGLMLNFRKHALVILSVVFSFFLVSLAVSLYFEYLPNTLFGLGSGLNMEGKEVRFGTVSSVIWSSVTTLASNGSVNAMHDSFQPLSGGAALFNILLGEVIFGGVGSGMYGMVLFIVLTVFIAGLMVGRTPEYLGKKIEAMEITYASAGILIPGAVLLAFSGLSSVVQAGLSSVSNSGPHGLSEILYAFASAANNNGSAFAGLNVNTPYYNILLGLSMIAGRYGVIIPALALAGSMAAKKKISQSSGTFPTDGVLFGILLSFVIFVIGALTFFPALLLGPVGEHLLLNQGRVF
ncbi:MAG TPA: potassium-transporting ATPase subunit KdpA [Leptospiraceae bacterium]|nr:potassium-transporting ATPase subunit KdpA [Leptospiraceae bacterium]HMY65491.1 potassium-transporting ATPase subunit KdpA [Leptospiraceae bacterium]HNF12222.1 potassium-transporting ATPase subunit KdpA [Leptospiraceae bacterium]HNF25429.1 potassium-transporting ATPase subunit KdpA [Leptospiraceae bacterium]HNI25176.1 potassium-transporting ATPase subunit KdpA [Leptospiraceae bacterium]